MPEPQTVDEIRRKLREVVDGVRDKYPFNTEEFDDALQREIDRWQAGLPPRQSRDDPPRGR